MGLCGFLFFYQSATRPLSSSHEARAAQNAQSILDHNDWLLPRLFDRRVELQKPPLYYWLVAICGRINGNRVNAWCVRLPAGLAALITVLFVYYLGLCQKRPLAGFLSAVVLATSLHFTWLARVGRIDMPLSLTTTVALVSFYLAHRRTAETSIRDDSGFLFLAYASIGFGVLLKGPIAVGLVGVVLCGCFIVSWWFGRGESGTGNRSLFAILHHNGVWWGIPLILTIALPWFVIANTHTRGELFRVFFWYHNFARGFGGAEELPSYPWWFYLFRLLIDMFPWSLTLPFACWSFFRRPVRDPYAIFGCVWLAAMLLSLSCLRFKRADYLLPAYPGLAIVLGCHGERLWQQTTYPRTLLRWSFFGVSMCIVMGWLVYILAGTPTGESIRPTKAFAKQIREHTTGSVIFFQVEAHDLAFELRTPLYTVMTWGNLERLSQKSETVYVVMTPKNVAKLNNGPLKQRLKELARTEELTDEEHDRPLVLLRSR